MPQFTKAGSSKHIQNAPEVPWQSWKLEMLSLTGVMVRVFYVTAQQLASDFLKKHERGKFFHLRVLRLHIAHSHEGVPATELLTSSIACFPGGQMEQLPSLLIKISHCAKRKMRIHEARERTGQALQSALGTLPSNGDSWTLVLERFRFSSAKPAGLLSVHSCRVTGT